jgi:hypothetical protein
MFATALVSTCINTKSGVGRKRWAEMRAKFWLVSVEVVME